MIGVVSVLAVNVLAVNVMVWVGLAVAGGVVFFLAMFLGTRWLSDVSTARLYGWRDAGMIYAAKTGDPVLEESGWGPLGKIHWTKSYGQRGEKWYFYFNCQSKITEAGLGLRWKGRMRPGSSPLEHPVLLLPWTDIRPAHAATTKGRGRPADVVILAPSQTPTIAISLPTPDATRLSKMTPHLTIH